MCIRDSYLDDIVIYSESMDQHLHHLREVLSRLKKAGLTVNPSKVNSAVKQFSFLGHKVKADGKVSIDPVSYTHLDVYKRQCIC